MFTEGGQKIAKSCLRSLWMPPSLENSDFFHNYYVWMNLSRYEWMHSLYQMDFFTFVALNVFIQMNLLLMGMNVFGFEFSCQSKKIHLLRIPVTVFCNPEFRKHNSARLLSLDVFSLVTCFESTCRGKIHFLYPLSGP